MADSHEPMKKCIELQSGFHWLLSEVTNQQRGSVFWFLLTVCG